MDHRHTTTARLDLTPIGLGDLEELHELHADAAVWRHFPSGRHTTVEQTEAFVTAMSWTHSAPSSPRCWLPTPPRRAWPSAWG